MELEGKKGLDASMYPESEGYIADDETRPGSTALDNHVHGGVRMREGADKPTTVEKIKEKLWQAENYMKGKEPSAIEDPHPELAYIAPMPQEEIQPGFFSRMGHKFGGQQQHEKEEIRNAGAAPTMELNEGVQPAPEMEAANNKGIGSSELGTGYEEDGEETINPAVVPKYDCGLKPPSEMQAAEKGVGSVEVGTGYEEGSEGSVSHIGDVSDFSFKEAQVESKQAASESETTSEDETHKKPGVFSRVLGGKQQHS